MKEERGTVSECGVQMIAPEARFTEELFQEMYLPHMERALDDYLAEHAQMWGPPDFTRERTMHTPGYNTWRCSIHRLRWKRWYEVEEEPWPIRDDEGNVIEGRFHPYPMEFVRCPEGEKDYNYEHHLTFHQTSPIVWQIEINAVVEYVAA